MKANYRIGLFIFILVIIYLAYNSINIDKINANTDTEYTEGEVTYVDNTMSDRASYYLFNVNGFVVVYLGDQKTPFEYTDIQISDLPKIIRDEIKNGKPIKSIEELYGFLENYSS